MSNYTVKGIFCKDDFDESWMHYRTPPSFSLVMLTKSVLINAYSKNGNTALKAARDMGKWKLKIAKQWEVPFLSALCTLPTKSVVKLSTGQVTITRPLLALLVFLLYHCSAILHTDAASSKTFIRWLFIHFRLLPERL